MQFKITIKLKRGIAEYCRQLRCRLVQQLTYITKDISTNITHLALCLTFYYLEIVNLQQQP